LNATIDLVTWGDCYETNVVPPELEAFGPEETIILGGIPRDVGGTYPCGVLKRFLWAGVAIDGEVVV